MGTPGDATGRVRMLDPPPSTTPPTLDSTARFRGPAHVPPVDGTGRFRGPVAPATLGAGGVTDGTARFRALASHGAADGTARVRALAADAGLDAAPRAAAPSPPTATEGTATMRSPAPPIEGTGGFSTVAMPLPPDAAALLANAQRQQPPAPAPADTPIGADLELPTLAPAPPRAGGKPNGKHGTGRGAKKGGAVRGPRHVDAEARETLIVADAVRLLKWGRQWHELGEAIARMAGRPGMSEIRRILRANKSAIEKQLDD